MGLKFKEESSEMLWSVPFCGAANWTHRKVDRNSVRILKCEAGEGWRSVGPVV
jgi:hypothetical protein